jgi:hypothetical protein
LLDVAPVLYSLRPGNAVFGGVDLRGCRVSRAKPAGARGDYVVIVQDDPRVLRTEYWLWAPADYAIVRRITSSGGKTHGDTEIAYARDPVSGIWLPDTWRITSFKKWDGLLQYTLQGR